MSAAVTKAGPYYSSGPISFSSLRINFKEVSSGSISASEIRRNTTVTNTNPTVPDATENSSISTSSNLSLSQFRNSIKYYYITQTEIDTNFDIDDQSWNGNLTKNVRKWMYMNGTCGSNSISSTAADFNATAYNLTIDISGYIYGCGGRGGGTGGPDPSGESGGDALGVRSSGGNNIVVFVRSSAQVYGGGGGGERGATGANGSNGNCITDYVTSGCGGAPGCGSGYETGSWSGGCCQSTCDWCWGCCERCVQNTRYRSCRIETPTSGGTGGVGGTGGLGRGYNNLSGSLSGVAGSPGTAGGGCGATDGATGETGGSGGDWASVGGNTSNSGSGGGSGRAIIGSNYSIDGIINSSTIKGLYNP